MAGKIRIRGGDGNATRDYVFRLAAVALTVFVVAVAKPVLVPLALAILLAFVLSPLVALIQRVGLGRVPATLLTLLLAITVAASLAMMISVQLTRLAGELPNHQAEIEEKLGRIFGNGQGPFARLATMVQDLAEKGPDSAAATAPPLRVRVDGASNLTRLTHLLEPVATAGLVTVLMVFILLGREDLRSRVLAMLGQARLIGTLRVLEDATHRIGQFLLFQLMVNATLGFLLGAGMAVMGVPYAPLWGFLTALLRFIPYVGTWISLMLPLALSFAISPDWHQPVMLVSYFLVLDLVTANVVEPLLFGHQTGVSPLALLLAASFWAWVWGPIGLLLSTPITVCLAVLGQHFKPMRVLGVLLGNTPALEPHVEYYQRVLSQSGSAAEPVALDAADNGAVAAFDTVLIPALTLAHKDREKGALTIAEELEVRDAVRAAIHPVVSRDRTDPPQSRPLVVLGTPAHDESEEVPLDMLAAALEQAGSRLEIATTRLLPADIIRQVAAIGASAVVVSSFPPGGLPQTAYLCRQLRKHYPDLVVVVARWGAKADYDELLVRLRKMGASYLTTSLAQTVAQLLGATEPVIEIEEAQPLPAVLAGATGFPA